MIQAMDLKPVTNGEVLETSSNYLHNKTAYKKAYESDVCDIYTVAGEGLHEADLKKVIDSVKTGFNKLRDTLNLSGGYINTKLNLVLSNQKDMPDAEGFVSYGSLGGKPECLCLRQTGLDNGIFYHELTHWLSTHKHLVDGGNNKLGIQDEFFAEVGMDSVQGCPFYTKSTVDDYKSRSKFTIFIKNPYLTADGLIYQFKDTAKDYKSFIQKVFMNDTKLRLIDRFVSYGAEYGFNWKSQDDFITWWASSFDVEAEKIPNVATNIKKYFKQWGWIK